MVRMSDVRVGHEDAPERPDRPTVDKDQTRHEGRSALNVIWNDAEFIQGQGPTSGMPTTNAAERTAEVAAYATVVSYFVERDEVDVDTNDTATDGTQPLAHGPLNAVGQADVTALDQGGNDDRPGFDDDGLKTETERTYRIYAVNNLLNGGTAPSGADEADDEIEVAVAPAEATDGEDRASVRSLPSPEAKGETAKPQEPGQPLDLTVTQDGHTEIRLTWDKPLTDDPEKHCTIPAPENEVTAGRLNDADRVEDDGSECGISAITGYRIERSESGTGGWTTIAESEKSPYLDTRLDTGKQYYYGSMP